MRATCSDTVLDNAGMFEEAGSRTRGRGFGWEEALSFANVPHDPNGVGERIVPHVNISKSVIQVVPLSVGREEPGWTSESRQVVCEGLHDEIIKLCHQDGVYEDVECDIEPHAAEDTASTCPLCV